MQIEKKMKNVLVFEEFLEFLRQNCEKSVHCRGMRKTPSQYVLTGAILASLAK